VDFKVRFLAGTGAEEVDADELDAPAGCSTHAVCCYIDILPRGDHVWPLPEPAEAACRLFCGLLGSVPLRCCRVDLVIRRALIALNRMDLGMTAYITACGPTRPRLRERWKKH